MKNILECEKRILALEGRSRKGRRGRSTGSKGKVRLRCVCRGRKVLMVTFRTAFSVEAVGIFKSGAGKGFYIITLFGLKTLFWLQPGEGFGHKARMITGHQEGRTL